MKVRFNSAFFTATMLGASLWAAAFFTGNVLAQVRPTGVAEIPNFDKRIRVEPVAEAAARRDAAQARLKRQLPSAVVDFDLLLDTPKFIRSRTGFLTGAGGASLTAAGPVAQAMAANDPHQPVKAFLNEHSALFGHGAEVLDGAVITRESVGPQNGLRTVVWQQQLDGLPVFEAVIIGNITRQGELASLASQFQPAPASMADAGTPNRASLQASPSVSAEQAIASAAQNVGDALAASVVIADGTEEYGFGYRRYLVRQRQAHARQVWLPMNGAAMRLCWEVFLTKQASFESFQILVDAETGEVLVRRGMTKHISDATYNVYTSDSPSPFSPGWPTPNAGQPPLTNRVLLTLSALDVTASPDGWINDGDNETQGNNTDAFTDRDFDFQADGPRAQGNPPRVFDFPLDLTQDPLTYSNASMVQMFYWVNWYHDRLYQLGFTENAGNYQNNNFGRGGLGGDRIISYVQSGADIGFNNNAFFIPAVDGINGQIAMFTWDFPDPDRDGDLDAEVIHHEATHGTSMRLVGGGVLISALQTDGMGEGWSDFYALALLAEPGDDPDAVYAMGGYVTLQYFGLPQNYYFGIRHFPYSTDLNKNPFTFKDIDPTQISPHPGVPRSPINPFNPNEADEVHHQGEVWCATLWECRANLVRKYGFPGNELTLQLVTDGMKLGPVNPTFLQARDAIILADLVNNGGVNAAELWEGFAKRGMGFSATSPDSTTTIGVFEAFDVPGLASVGLNVYDGNGNGIADTNECNSFDIILANFNPNTVTGIRVTLSTTTPGVALGVRSSDYLDLLPRQLGTNLVPFTVSTAPFFTCGTPITLQVVIKSDQATTTNTMVINSGTIGTPVRFDSTGPVLIPDDNPVGTNSVITVSNITSSLRDVEVSLYLSHTFDADLRFELIAPDGTVVALVDSFGGSGDNYGAGCSPESLRTTFDDDAGIPIGSAVPPFVGRFRPLEPLSAFIGKSGSNVNGIWRLHAVDQVALDVGVVQCWSLFLSAAECEDGGGTCPGAELGLGIQDAPDPVFIGSNLVYTISVTNNGPSEAKTVVVNQFLPPSVVFVSAIASQGNATHSGGTVVANLGNLLFTGVATITVNVAPTAVGLISSSASVSSSDTDPDTSNNSRLATTLVAPPAAELSVTLLDAPDPTVTGGSLTYTLTVTNNGPSAASGVTVTNTLPLGAILQSVTPSQGFVTISGNVVICHFGTLTNRGNATAVINVTPTAQGTLVATARAAANQPDPVSGNNTATATTTVGPAADVTLSLVDTPDPVVVGSNWTYVLAVTNLGPNVANAVVVNQSLPNGVSLVSSNTTQGSLTVSSGTLTASLGALASGSGAVITAVVNATNSGIYSTSANVTGGQADPNTANNSAGATTTVSPPNVNIVAAGATLLAESISPPNGALDVGETVTVQLRLRNAGNVNNTNLVATLLAGGGVTSPSPATPVNYGVLAPSGVPVGQTFAFTASGTSGGAVVATLQLQDSGVSLSNVIFTFTLPNVRTFSNTNVIVIADGTNASPYPSTILVSGVTGLVANVTATLSNMTHTYVEDVDALLVGPNGQKVMLLSDAGAPSGLINATVTLDGSAAAALPDEGQIVSTSYKPADYEPGDLLNAPAPAGPYGTNLAAFNDANANGTWSLFIVDDFLGDAGGVSNGWSLSFTTIAPVNQLADLALSGSGSSGAGLVGETLSYTFTITNRGPNAATGVAFTNVVPAGAVLLGASVSQGSVLTNGNQTVGSLGTINSAATATVTITVRLTAAGSLSNGASVAASETDLNPANNTAAVMTTVSLPVADVAIGKLAATGSVVIGSNISFTISVTNRGPQTALNVVVTDPLPAGQVFVTATAVPGSYTHTAGTVIASLGDLSPGQTAMVTILATATTVGAQTNFVSVATVSSDTNAANDAASAVVMATVPAPSIVNAGATLLAENLAPPNGAVDFNETVTLALALQNAGSAGAANLVATLQPSGGVTAPSGPQNYGALSPGGAAVVRPFTFTASGTNGGVVAATLQLQDGANDLGTVTFAFALPMTMTFTNPTAITIPDHGGATPYPSTIVVSGLSGLTSKVQAGLIGVTHGFPDDLDVLLAGPQGQKVVLMSDAGGGHSISNLWLSFDDAGAVLPDSATIVAGTFAPTDFESGDLFLLPAPAGGTGSGLGSLSGIDPNGTWSLFVVDDSTGDGGSIGSWTLTITTVSTVSPVTDMGISVTDAPDPIYIGSGLTYTIGITNRGASSATGVIVTDTLPATASFVSAFASQGSCTNVAGVVTCDLGTVAAGSGATVTLRVAPSLGGTLVNSASVTATEVDLNTANNTVQTTTLVVVPAPATLADVVLTNGTVQFSLTGEPNMAYTIQASTDLSSWVSIGTGTTAVNGILKFTDTEAPGHGYRFYRAIRLIP